MQIKIEKKLKKKLVNTLNMGLRKSIPTYICLLFVLLSTSSAYYFNAKCLSPIFRSQSLSRITPHHHLHLSLQLSEKPPIKPGPIQFIKKKVLLTFLIIKLNSLKAFSSILRTVQSMVNGRPESQKSKLLKSLIQDNAYIKYVRKFWIRFLVIIFSFIMSRRYMAFTKSLITEIPYTAFLKLISTAPERILSLKATPSIFSFLLDGKTSITRIVNIDPLVMGKLISSGIDFEAPPEPTNILGLIYTVGYAGFLLNLATKMMQGPQDEATGKRKDKAGELDAYGKFN